MKRNLSDARVKEKDRLFVCQLRKLEALKTSPANKRKLKEFIRDKQLLGVKNTSITPYLHAIIRLLSSVDKDFEDMTEGDLKSYFARMKSLESQRGVPYSDVTIHDHERNIKFFFKWLNGGESFPDCVKWIKGRKLKKTNVVNDDLLSVEDIEAMIRHTINTRDQAIIATLYDSAARAWEFCNVRIKDVRFDKLGALMKVTGKSGTRDIRLINSVPYLQAWLEVHPFRDDGNAFLWYNLKGRKWAQVSRQTLERILDRAVVRAGIKKRVYPHLFRHSRLTELAPKIPEQALKAFAGWGQDSRMAAVYIHMSNKLVDDALAIAHGIKPEKEPGETVLSPKVCPRCKTRNPATAKYCSSCSMVLDQEEALKADLEARARDSAMAEYMKDPNALFQRFQEFLQHQTSIPQGSK